MKDRDEISRSMKEGLKNRNSDGRRNETRGVDLRYLLSLRAQDHTSLYVEGSKTVGPDPIVDKSSPMTSDKMKEKHSAPFLTAARPSLPPLTALTCFLMTFMSFIEIPEWSSVLVKSFMSCRVIPSVAVSQAAKKRHLLAMATGRLLHRR